MVIYPNKHPSYNLYSPEKGEKIYAYPIYKFDKYDSQNRPIYVINITGFNNWHAVLGWKYMGKKEYDDTYPSNKKPGYDSNIGFAANDWDDIYYISGKKTTDYPLNLKELGDVVSVNDLYRENARDTLAGVFEDFYNCPYYKDLQSYIEEGKNACIDIANKKFKISAPVYSFSTSESYDIDDIVFYNDEYYKANENISAGDWNSEKWSKISDISEISANLDINKIITAIAVIDDNIVFNFVQKQDLWDE